jgi:hypothetical protein
VFLGPIIARGGDGCSDDVGHTQRRRIGFGSQCSATFGSCAHTISTVHRREGRNSTAKGLARELVLLRPPGIIWPVENLPFLSSPCPPLTMLPPKDAVAIGLHIAAPRPMETREIVDAPGLDATARSSR